jgi:hypothetical protein
MWGTISPTKLMMPATDTAEADSSEDMVISSSLKASVCSPQALGHLVPQHKQV